MLEVGKCGSYIVLHNFHEVSGFGNYAKILNCFVDKEDILLFDGSIVSEIGDEMEYIKEHTCIESTYWIGYFEPDYEIEEPIPWFLPKGINEIVEAIKINSLFKCIVLEKGRSITEYKYSIEHLEEDYGSSLYINEGILGSFWSNVLPRLKELVSIKE